MKYLQTGEQQFVICIRNDDYPASLEAFKVYQMLPDSVAAERHQIRIIDESGEDYLYPDDFFVSIELPQIVREALRSAA